MKKIKIFIIMVALSIFFIRVCSFLFDNEKTLQFLIMNSQTDSPNLSFLIKKLTKQKSQKTLVIEIEDKNSIKKILKEKKVSPNVSRLKLRANANFSLLNVYDKEGNRPFPPYDLLEIEGKRIAVIGVLDPSFNQGNEDYLKDYDIRNPLKEFEEFNNFLEPQGYLIFIVVHGNEQQSEGQNYTEELAKTFKSADFIVASSEKNLNQKLDTPEILGHGNYRYLIELDQQLESLAQISLILQWDDSLLFHIEKEPKVQIIVLEQAILPKK